LPEAAQSTIPDEIMFEFVFDLPLAVSGPAIIALLVIYTIAGVLLVRRFILPRLRVRTEDSEFSGAMLQCVMVFYGLAVALIAVGVWETYSSVSAVVSAEATAIASLYRDVSTYPEPARSDLQWELREYTDQVIRIAWPLQQRGTIPQGGVKAVDRFQAVLARFEPATEGQKLLHAECLRAYNMMIQARRQRLDAVQTGLPTVMWVVVVAGAFIGLASSFFFKADDARLHCFLASLLATFMGLVIFMIVALDRPFRGDLGVSSSPYRLIYQQLMDGKAKW